MQSVRPRFWFDALDPPPEKHGLITHKFPVHDSHHLERGLSRPQRERANLSLRRGTSAGIPVGQGLIARESWGPEPRTGMVFSCFAGIGGQESQGPGHRREQAPPWCLATIL